MLSVLLQAIETHGLPHWKNTFLALQKPSLRITTHLVCDELPLGSSKIGGLPDLPPHLVWPTNTQRSLSFIAQLNLGEVPYRTTDAPIPKTGMLYFFYDIVDLPCTHEASGIKNWHIWYYPATNDITRCAAPLDITDSVDDLTLLRPALITWKSETTYPEWSNTIVWKLFGAESEAHYDAVLEAVVATGMAVPNRDSLVYHRCSGYPDTIQPVDMVQECMEVLLPEETAYNDWQLLLQIDSDTTNADTLWADSGRLYFWVLKQDAEKHCFDRVWLTLQAY
jgi:hypothetical protein